MPLSSIFWFGCIPTRVAIVGIAAVVEGYGFRTAQLVLASIAVVIAIGFIFMRNKQVGFFGGRVWWGSLRPVHSVLYGIYAIMSFMGILGAPLALAIDVVVAVLGKLLLS